MAASSRPSNAEKLDFCKKLVTFLKKRYKISVPKQDDPVLQTMLLAVCLENSTFEEAQASLKQMETDFHDLNEVRVSSIAELEATLKAQSDAEHRAHEIRNILQYVFEKMFSFEFETFRKKNVEQATKILNKIRNLSSFVKLYVMQHCLNSHVIPLDLQMTGALIWLGLLEPNTDPEAGAENIKSCIRKNDASDFCHFLRCLSTDEKLKDHFLKAGSSANFDQPSLQDGITRLTKLIANPRAAGKTATKTARVKKPPATAKSSRRKTAEKTTAKKTTTKKVATKKTVVKKRAAKKK
ncbi:MAG: hypothetical protein O2955_15385 [Planctomycetota bacterium]|nr:hypothetical protein [Planctomycetota bacterium]MDA1213897.1 hypothetical protein [Planctomycetota bacterium]